MPEEYFVIALLYFIAGGNFAFAVLGFFQKERKGAAYSLAMTTLLLFVAVSMGVR